MYAVTASTTGGFATDHLERKGGKGMVRKGGGREGK